MGWRFTASQNFECSLYFYLTRKFCIKFFFWIFGEHTVPQDLIQQEKFVVTCCTNCCLHYATCYHLLYHFLSRDIFLCLFTYGRFCIIHSITRNKIAVTESRKIIENLKWLMHQPDTSSYIFKNKKLLL